MDSQDKKLVQEVIEDKSEPKTIEKSEETIEKSEADKVETEIRGFNLSQDFNDGPVKNV